MEPRAFITPDALLRDSFVLARRIYDSGYRPDVVLVLWRGGTPIGIVVHEFLAYKGIETYHTVIKADSYVGIDQRMEPRIENLDRVVAAVSPGARVLVVDDIFDSGCTLQAVCAALREKTEDIRTATLYVRRGHNLTELSPDFFIRECDHWLVFPHELVGLTPDEIAQKHPSLADLVL